MEELKWESRSVEMTTTDCVVITIVQISMVRNNSVRYVTILEEILKTSTVHIEFHKSCRVHSKRVKSCVGKIRP